VAVYLEAGEEYTFKIYSEDNNGTWYGANDIDIINGTTTINSFSTSNASNFSLNASTSGYYVFSTNWDSGLSLTVRYPNTKVYFYNTLGWSNVYIHDGYWNGDKGASNVNALRGIPMAEEDADDNIYSVYIPRESFYRVTFTSEKQVNNNDGDYGKGYDNYFYHKRSVERSCIRHK
jgi:hypothetical protein